MGRHALFLAASIPGVLAGAIGSRAGQAGHEGAKGTPTRSAVVASAVALLVPTSCVQQALGTPVGSVAAPITAPQTALLIAKFDYGYRPCAVSIRSGKPVPLTLVNVGYAYGTFVIDELGIRTGDLGPGEEIVVVIDAPPGVYSFSSDYPGQRGAGRAGILTVVGDATPVAAT